MSAPIIEHQIVPHPDDNPAHPIPFMDALDVMSITIGGGADLFIVVASPLMDDQQSQKRLLDKLENYLHFIGSAEFQTQAGPASASNTQVIVKLHPSSASGIYDLLKRSETWVLAGGATLSVVALTAQEMA
jgi:hypothetical protein